MAHLAQQGTVSAQLMLHILLATPPTQTALLQQVIKLYYNGLA